MVVVILSRNVQFKNGGHFKISPPYHLFVALGLFYVAISRLFLIFLNCLIIFL